MSDDRFLFLGLWRPLAFGTSCVFFCHSTHVPLLDGRRGCANSGCKCQPWMNFSLVTTGVSPFCSAYSMQTTPPNEARETHQLNCMMRKPIHRKVKSLWTGGWASTLPPPHSLPATSLNDFPAAACPTIYDEMRNEASREGQRKASAPGRFSENMKDPSNHTWILLGNGFSTEQAGNKHG